jgi:signal transduction histidine kinase
MTIIQVENWGIGIPPDRLEEIFEPFVRGDVEDRIKAIRGMGLGLFLGRRIMSAHRGELFCLRSDPTLDDPRRTERLEGFQTIFELRLPVDLKEGTVTVDLNESSRPR